MDLDLTQLDEWIDSTLGSLPGVEGASRNPAGLNYPGILVQVVGLGVDTLAQDEWRVDLRVLLITSDLDVVSATDALVDLVNKVRPALGNRPGDFLPTTYQTDQGSSLPALSLTHTIRINEE